MKLGQNKEIQNIDDIDFYANVMFSSVFPSSFMFNLFIILGVINI